LQIAGFDHPYSAAVVEEFRRAHPDITVEVSTVEVTFEEGSVQTLLRSGQAPDVLLVNSGPGRVGLLADGGLVADLSELYAERGLSQRYRPAVLDQITRQGGGAPFEVVEGLDVFQVHFNKEFFTRAGVAVPTTFDELRSACAPLAGAGVLPMTVGARDNFAGGWLLGTLVQSSAGAKAMSEVIYGDGAFDQPAIVRGGEMLRELVEAGCIDAGQAAALDQEQAEAAFLAGEAAMTVMPQGPMAELRAEGGDVSRFDSFPMPALQPGVTAVPTAGLALSWVVPADTDAKSAVYEWLDWVSSEEYLQLAADSGMTLAPSRVVPDGASLDPAIQDAVDALATDPGYNPSVYLSASAKDAWYQAVQGLLTGGTSPNAAMAGVQAELEKSRAEGGG
jgi:raffinose/stachyose/melibiose transport system substrate-binding protein